jgi:hypothetical protein
VPLHFKECSLGKLGIRISVFADLAALDEIVSAMARTLTSRAARELAFFLLQLSQPDPRASAILLDELYAG